MKMDMDSFIHKVEEEDKKEMKEEKDLIELRREKVATRDEMMDILFTPQQQEKKWS